MSTFPSAGASGVPTNNSIAVILNTAIDGSTLQAATFTVKCGGLQMPGTMAYDATNHTIVIHLSSGLPANSTCTVAIGGSLGPITFSFTTAEAPDLTAPTILSVSPAADATGVSTTVKITVHFSKAMDPTFLNGSTTNGVPGTYTYDSTTFTGTLVPNAALQPNTIYSVTISGSVRDMWGNALGHDYSWKFSTGN